MYVTIMYFNERLEIWVTAAVKRESRGNSCTRCFKKFTDHVLFETLCTVSSLMLWLCLLKHGCHSDHPKLDIYHQHGVQCVFHRRARHETYYQRIAGHWRDPLNVFDGVLVALIVLEWVLSLMSTGDR